MSDFMSENTPEITNGQSKDSTLKKITSVELNEAILEHKISISEFVQMGKEKFHNTFYMDVPPEAIPMGEKLRPYGIDEISFHPTGDIMPQIKELAVLETERYTQKERLSEVENYIDNTFFQDKSQHRQEIDGISYINAEDGDMYEILEEKGYTAVCYNPIKKEYRIYNTETDLVCLISQCTRLEETEIEGYYEMEVKNSDIKPSSLVAYFSPKTYKQLKEKPKLSYYHISKNGEIQDFPTYSHAGIYKESNTVCINLDNSSGKTIKCIQGKKTIDLICNDWRNFHETVSGKHLIHYKNIENSESLFNFGSMEHIFENKHDFQALKTNDGKIIRTISYTSKVPNKLTLGFTERPKTHSIDL